ncbi:unnamed protein product [Darwinula stevensoni]|uniref:Myosin motor domain-containing protein n=1 Tax=Darwinula stevensoni TaxID=69355 RepID=A0A7R9FP33_9CRUS|nr:unnamed protein product [Darwinula stevensoni]CAG0897110.1 unnamed protein product [Darwinula stevensoni]
MAKTLFSLQQAFGNAKTTQNDNSSRFGKYIQLDYTKQNTIMGAFLRTYLLEKSRVVFQADNERSYHIFYQLCSARNSEEMKPLSLGLTISLHQDQFHYLNQGKNSYIDGIDDSKQFQETKTALNIFGIFQNLQIQLYRVLAAILHIGNITILDSIDESESCGIPFAFIVEFINKNLTRGSSPARFIGILDIYGFEIFDRNSFEQLCINYANEKLQQQYCQRKEDGIETTAYKLIKLKFYHPQSSQFNVTAESDEIDIQLMLNFIPHILGHVRNSLQQVFVLEQEEYSREEIDWKSIDFYDNQPCIDLIEGKPLGILSLLDEECRMPNGSDKSWVGKLYDECQKQQHFIKPKFSNSAFLISHFAGKVEYECEGFLDKNRDIVHEELIEVVKDSDDAYVAEMFLSEEERSGKSKKRQAPMPPGTSTSIGKASTTEVSPASKHLKHTVGSQFRDSLNQLMNALNATTPHYVRCIKPNRNKNPSFFDKEHVTQQLRACGVYETIRISTLGWPYEEFFLRFRVLINSKDIGFLDLTEDPSVYKTSCIKIIQRIMQDEEAYKFGKTKLFLRANALANMEKCLSDRILACHILIQKIIRGYLSRRKYKQVKQSVLLLQTFARGFLARRGKTAFLHTYRLAKKIRRTRAAIKIQKNVRAFICQRRYQRLRASVIRLQTLIRAHNARLHHGKLLRNAKVVVIQRHFKGYSARRKFKHIKETVLFLQTCGRGLLARKFTFLSTSRIAEDIRRERAAKKIQKIVRTFISQRKYQRLRSWVIQFQAFIRGRKARLHYGTLHRRAKVLIHVLISCEYVSYSI